MSDNMIPNVSFSEKLKRTKIAIFDLDGTLYLGDSPIFGAAEALKKLRSAGKKIVFLTNNSSKTASEYLGKLDKMGLYDGDRILTSSEAAAKYLASRGENDNVFLFARREVKGEFEKFGVRIVEKNSSVAVLAYNTRADYGDICAFDRELRGGARYIATHADLVCPTSGLPVPDCGSFIELFAASSGRRPEVIIGKPSAVMGETIMREYGAKAEEILMVGDRLYTDVAFGRNCGFLTSLVLSGETTAQTYAVSQIKADAVFPSVTELAGALTID